MRRARSFLQPPETWRPKDENWTPFEEPPSQVMLLRTHHPRTTILLAGQLTTLDQSYRQQLLPQRTRIRLVSRNLLSSWQFHRNPIRPRQGFNPRLEQAQACSRCRNLRLTHHDHGEVVRRLSFWINNYLTSRRESVCTCLIWTNEEVVPTRWLVVTRSHYYSAAAAFIDAAEAL